MPNNFTSERLSLKPLTLSDAEFILALVNTTGWIRFIGDRKVNDIYEANAYIKKILSIPTIKYWVVRLKNAEIPVGIVTFIKRDYLLYHDIGFAFLPAYAKNGYAFEAASGLIAELVNEYQLRRLLATTITENLNSISLLNKLGFRFDKEIQVDGKSLLVYTLTTEGDLTEEWPARS